MFLKFLYYGFRAYCFFFRPVRMGVRVMMIQAGRVWLVRQTYMPGWFLPGGGVKRGETLAEAARREAQEETGAALAELSLLGAYTNFTDWKTDHNILFLCEDFTFGGTPDAEIAELRAFPLDAPPVGLLPGHRRRLEEYISGNINPFGEW